MWLRRRRSSGGEGVYEEKKNRGSGGELKGRGSRKEERKGFRRSRKEEV